MCFVDAQMFAFRWISVPSFLDPRADLECKAVRTYMLSICPCALNIVINNHMIICIGKV